MSLRLFSLSIVSQSSRSAHRFAPKSRKTGRICGNCVLPRQAWRYDAAMGKNFQKTMGKRVGFEMGLSDRVLLTTLSQRHRRLDEKKMRQLNQILTAKIEEAASGNEAVGRLAVQFSKVKVNDSFTEAAVSWLCTGENDENVAEVLERERHSLRKTLSESLGANCPEIRLVPDRTNLLIKEMDQLFKKADYGADYRTMSKTASILGNVEEEKEEKKEKVKPPPMWRQKLRDDGK